MFAYDRGQAKFVLATPSFAKYLPMRSTTEAASAADEYRHDQPLYRCAALGPALELIYSGRMSEGQELFRRLYRASDAAAVEQKALELAKTSRYWTPH